MQICTKKIIHFGVLLSFIFATQSFAQTRLTAQSIMKFLNIGVGAKAAGMGDCYTSTVEDASVIFWNPAGLATLSGKNAFLDQNLWIADIKQYSFAYTHNLGNWGVLGASATYMDYGDIYGTTIDLVAATSGSFEYVETGKVDVGNYALGLAYARAISSQFSIGAHFKYVYSNLGSNTILENSQSKTMQNTLKAFAIDIGTWYKTGYKGISFLMALRNFSREVNYPKMRQSYYLPLIFSIGFAADALRFVPSIDEKHSLIVACKGLHPMDYLEKGSFGLEYSYNKKLFLRSGYKINFSLENFSFGLGIRHNIHDHLSLCFDYSYANMKYFSGANRFSFVFNF